MDRDDAHLKLRAKPLSVAKSVVLNLNFILTLYLLVGQSPRENVKECLINCEVAKEARKETEEGEAQITTHIT